MPMYFSYVGDIDADTKAEVFAALDPGKSYALIVAEDV